MAVFISLLTAFAIVGFVTVVKELIYENLHTKNITLYTKNNENDIEFILRSLRKNFPNANIIVKDLHSDDSTPEIAEKLNHKL